MSVLSSAQLNHIISNSRPQIAKMVHLAAIPQDSEANKLPEAVSKVSLQLSEEEDSFTTSIYGSRFAAEDLPRLEIPDGEMPKEIAYKLIKDELSLDGNPMLK